MFLGASEFKVLNLIYMQCMGQFKIYVRCLLGWHDIFSLNSADDSQYAIGTKQLSNVAILLYRFSSFQCLELSFTQYQLFSLLFVIIFFWPRSLKLPCQQHFSHAVPCSYWFLINNGTYICQTWTHAVPVNPKLYLLGTYRVGVPDQMQPVVTKLESMQKLKIDSKKIFTCQVFDRHRRNS